jgi:hypothetical protein
MLTARSPHLLTPGAHGVVAFHRISDILLSEARADRDRCGDGDVIT